jgi:hypothetical protein
LHSVEFELLAGHRHGRLQFGHVHYSEQACGWISGRRGWF